MISVVRAVNRPHHRSHALSTPHHGRSDERTARIGEPLERARRLSFVRLARWIGAAVATVVAGTGGDVSIGCSPAADSGLLQADLDARVRDRLLRLAPPA